MPVKPYQINLIDEVSLKTVDNRTIIAQLPTGGGKTVIFSNLIKRYIDATPGDVLILVHREELLAQASRTLYDWSGIIVEPVSKKMQSSRVYIGMVETVHNRLKKNADLFRNVTLVIVDEAHIGNFRKVLDYFPDKKIVGFSATPISAVKKIPMKNGYQTIVTGPQISELIKSKDLVPCLTYGPRNIDKKDLHVKMGEYDQAEMAGIYSRSKHVQNTVEKYIEHALGKKTIIFNCSVEHSKLVCQAFNDAGFLCKHLDGNSDDREEVLKWLKETPEAIVCSIGILTTGFDEPSIECIIVNKSTKSLTLYLQMCGRGGRPFPGKKYFIIIDMGDNVKDHREWSDDRDWNWMFNNPDDPKPKESGVAGIKMCISCEGVIPIQALKCKWCDALQPVPEPTYDDILGEFVLITKNIDVIALVKDNKTTINSNGKERSPYSVLHDIKSQIVRDAKKKLKKLTDEGAYALLTAYQDKVREWCKETGKKYNDFHKAATGEWMLQELYETFLWKPATYEI